MRPFKFANIYPVLDLAIYVKPWLIKMITSISMRIRRTTTPVASRIPGSRNPAREPATPAMERGAMVKVEEEAVGILMRMNPPLKTRRTFINDKIPC